jgi:hypothetical protein
MGAAPTSVTVQLRPFRARLQTHLFLYERKEAELWIARHLDSVAEAAR